MLDELDVDPVDDPDDDPVDDPDDDPDVDVLGVLELELEEDESVELDPPDRESVR